MFKTYKARNLIFTSKGNFDEKTQFWIVLPKQ
jgi:hypothetical protein